MVQSQAQKALGRPAFHEVEAHDGGHQQIPGRGPRDCRTARGGLRFTMTSNILHKRVDLYHIHIYTLYIIVYNYNYII